MAKKLSEILNLERAYNDVLHSEQHGDDLIPDILHFYDSKNLKARILEELKQEIDGNRFQIRDLLKMDAPKGNFFIRPAARPCLRDWVVYHALANYVGLEADKKLSHNVYSSRFDSKTGKLLPWAEQWLKFERAFWVNFDKGFKHVLKTDITAYFANISIERLRSSIIGMLDGSQESDQIVEFLFEKLLRPWAQRERNKGFGLPQGIGASSILANLFLNHVDVILSRNRNSRYLRYADDLRILAKTEIEVKIALKTLISELSRIGLDLNEKKTQILNPLKAEQELRDPKRQNMDTVRTILRSGNHASIKNWQYPC
jgi:hypothetical protein